jgi:hypothetical protein
LGIERKIRAFHNVIGIGAIARRDGNTNAGTSGHLMPVKIEGFAQRFSNSLGKFSGLYNRICYILNNGELIAAKPGDQGSFPDALTQPRGNSLEQSIARRMSERVIDFLEAIEIEHEHCQVGAAPARHGKRVLQMFPQQCAIWQVGQRVMVSHVSNSGFRAPLLGNVEMCRYPAATGHWLSSYADQTTIGQFINATGSHVGG